MLTILIQKWLLLNYKTIILEKKQSFDKSLNCIWQFELALSMLHRTRCVGGENVGPGLLWVGRTRFMRRLEASLAHDPFVRNQSRFGLKR